MKILFDSIGMNFCKKKLEMTFFLGEIGNDLLNSSNTQQFFVTPK